MFVLCCSVALICARVVVNAISEKTFSAILSYQSWSITALDGDVARNVTLRCVTWVSTYFRGLKFFSIKVNMHFVFVFSSDYSNWYIYLTNVVSMQLEKR